MSTDRRPAPLPRLNLLMLLAELGIVAVCTTIFTAHLIDLSPDTRLPGSEFSFVINSGAFASEVYRQSGKLPLWNPFMNSGEPAFESLFSFLLNPFMTLPMLWLGPIPGAKLALLLHIGLLGLGGWALARVLGLGSPGRVFLGLLLAGNGSVIGAMSFGFYQISLSQVYFPWIMTGLIAVLYRSKRWPIGLLAVAATLQIFAGTFWYVLPSMISAVIVTVFFLLRRDPQTRRWHLNTSGLNRLMLAAVLTIGLSAAYVLPQVNAGLAHHPPEGLRQQYTFFDILGLYFNPGTIPGHDLGLWVSYHYILPNWLLQVLLYLSLAVLFWRRTRTFTPVQWRILAAGLIIAIFFTYWAQEGAPLIRWLYATFRFLSNWRTVGRMSAAATPWIATIAAIMFDRSIQFLQSLLETARRDRSLANRALMPLFRAAILGLVAAGLIGSASILSSWQDRIGYFKNDGPELASLHYLRTQHPGDFLSAMPLNFYGLVGFYDPLVRAASGNPDYWIAGRPSTIGPAGPLNVIPEYAVGLGPAFEKVLEERHYSRCHVG